MTIDWNSQSVNLVVGVVSSLVSCGLIYFVPRCYRWHKKWTAAEQADAVKQAKAIRGNASLYAVRVVETILLGLDAIFRLVLGILAYVIVAFGPQGWWNLLISVVIGFLAGDSFVTYYLFKKEYRIAKQAVRNQPGNVINEGENESQ